MKQQLLILCFFSLFFSCKKETIDATRIIDLQYFDHIEINSALEVILKEGNTFSAEIIGDEKLIQDIELIVENGLLSIDNKRKLKWTTPTKNNIKIVLTSNPLKKIIASGGCNIHTVSPITSTEFGLILNGKANQANLELGGNTFYYWNNFPCGGKITLFGQVETLKIWNSAIMSVDAKELISKNAIVENSSKGDCEVNVLNRIEYSINGEGNIQLYGKPIEVIENNLSSSGRLIRN